MGLLTKPIKTLDDLFVHTLQDIYYAEQQITKALPKIIESLQGAGYTLVTIDELMASDSTIPKSIQTGDAAQQTSGEAGEQAQAVDYASLPLDAEGYPVE